MDWLIYIRYILHENLPFPVPPLLLESIDLVLGDSLIYEKFYGLTERPFSILPDPDFLFWASTHSMAYAVLEAGILAKSGITVITGDIGSGKTTLIRHLLNKLPEDVTVGLLSNTHKSTDNIMAWVMMSLGLEFEGASHVTLFKRFQDHLIEEYFKNRRTILIIDEAQNLSEDELEELRLLSNINADKEDIIQLILVGQHQLKDLLARPGLEQFAQRVTTDFNLCPLSKEEVHEYITHRLRIAGTEKEIFTDEAIDWIYESSHGIPRLINILCNTAMIYGFSDEKQIIDKNTVVAVINDKKVHGAVPMGPDTLHYPRLILNT